MDYDIYIDESGYTGVDFVNPDQPLFSLACNMLSHDELNNLSSTVFCGDKGSELKFSRLLGRSSGQKKLHAFIDYLESKDDKFCCYLVDKRSALTRKFVDDCILPALTLDGVNLFKDGVVLIYVNQLAYYLPATMGLEWYDAFLRHYNYLIRRRDEDALQKLWQHCMQTLEHEKAAELLSPFLHKPQLAYIKITAQPYNPGFYEAILTGLIIHLRSCFGINSAKVIYDFTKATSTHGLASFIGNISNLGETFRISDVCTLTGDFSVSTVSAVNSVEHYGVQVSDIIAGLFNYSFRSDETIKSDIASHLRQILTNKNFIHMFDGAAEMFNEPDLKGSQISTLIETIKRRKEASIETSTNYSVSDSDEQDILF
ncbi:MAG: DUF3800 domain-containing protein [Nitrospirota bacterium]